MGPDNNFCTACGREDGQDAHLIKLVREYFVAKARYESWGPARNLQVKGAAREKARAKARREFNAADDALRAAVGVDGFGKLVSSNSTVR